MTLIPKKSTNRIYVDSNVFLNIWFEEMGRFGDIYYSSKKLFENITLCKHHLVISELTIKELSKKTELADEVLYDSFLRIYRILNKMTIVKVTRKVADDAVYLSSAYGIHKTDALHAIMAKLNNCLLVTRDIELIDASTKYGIETFRPEDLI